MADDIARHRLDRVRTELDRLEDVLGLPDALAKLTTFTGLDPDRFFEIGYSQLLNPARRWEVAIFLGRKWQNPKAEHVHADPWVKGVGPSPQIAVERLLAKLDLTTPKETQP